jgi:hypothetical protein
MKKAFIVLLAAALAVAFAAERHSLTLLQPAVLGATELEPGVYKLTVSDGQIVLEKGGARVSARVRIETAGQKFPTTTVRLRKEERPANGASSQYRITEIRLGGTNRKLVVSAD